MTIAYFREKSKNSLLISRSVSLSKLQSNILLSFFFLNLVKIFCISYTLKTEQNYLFFTV